MNRRFSQSVFRSAPLSFVSGSADCLQSNIYMTFWNADFGSVPRILVLHRHVCLLPISSCLWNIPPKTCNVSNSYKLLVSTSTILRSVTWRRIESHRSPCDGNWLYTWNHARNKCNHAIGKTNFSRSTRGPSISSLYISIYLAHANELGQLGQSTFRILLSHPAQTTQTPVPSPGSSQIECIHIPHAAYPLSCQAIIPTRAID